MSTEIKATCPSCGEVALRESAVLLTIFDWGDFDTYSFFCPSCKAEVTKQARPDVVAVLEHVVHVKRLHVPMEIQEGGRTGPALTPDDAMEFILELYATEARVPDATPARKVIPKDCEPIRTLPHTT